MSGLIYESIWSQYLKQFLGHAAYAQTLVLVIYMGGMALGAWIAASFANQGRNLLRAYGIAEIALGAFALVFHNLFLWYLDISFTTVIPFLGQPLPVSAYKWITSAFIILPQSMLLGATFPLMAGGMLRRFPGLSGYKTSVIYFVNTLGASLGVLISGFYLVREWGLRGAIITGGLIDLFVGVSVILLCLRDKSACVYSIQPNADTNTTPQPPTAIDAHTEHTYTDDEYPPTDHRHPINKQQYPSIGHRYYRTLLVISAATAAASFIYEIGWIRMLSLVLGSSTHSFELMLSAFILGLALGSFFIRNKIDGIINPARFLAVVQIAMGASAIMTLFIYSNMFEFMAFIISGLRQTSQGYVFYNILSHLICMIIMLPATICAGMVIPLIINMLLKNGNGEQVIGKVYAVNTFGGIIGVVVSVWLLMELVGLKYLIIIGATIDIGIGLFVLHRFHNAGGELTRLLANAVCIAVLFSALVFSKIDPVLISSGVFRYGRLADTMSNTNKKRASGNRVRRAANERVVSHIDGKTASITLFRSGGRYLVLSTNGKPDASVGMGDEFSSDEYTMALLGILPLAIHDTGDGDRTHTRSAAVIGMGAGMTSHFMLHDPSIERLDVVEIERAMVTLAQRIGPKVANTFTDPRCNIYIEDAKTFFSAQNRTYDIIVSEPSNPWVSGVSSLFSVEFFDRIRHHLNDGGILVQWFHSYEADVRILASILKALGESFPVYDMYTLNSDLLIIAGKDADTDVGIKRDVFAIAPIAESLNLMGFEKIDDFKLLRYAGRDLLEPFLNTYDVPANTDFHSFVDLYAAKYRFMESSVWELAEISDFVIPIRKILAGADGRSTESDARTTESDARTFADTAYIELSPDRLLPELQAMTATQRAKALHRELVFGGHQNGVRRSDSEEFGAVLILDYAQIRPERINYMQIQSAITQILQTTLPYLSSGEMKEIWEAISQKIADWEFSDNGVRRSDNEAKWLDYFQAICTYDIPNMRRLSLELLPQDTITATYTNQVLMTSLLVSSTVLGDTSDIAAVWSRYEERNDPPVPIRAAMSLFRRSL